jgi:hypothetical protein
VRSPASLRETEVTKTASWCRRLVGPRSSSALRETGATGSASTRERLAQ